jgi:glucan phosphoethanolaminetransferase (alkaline phosphatase superfamily)
MSASFFKISFALFLALLLCMYLPAILDAIFAIFYPAWSKDLSKWVSIALSFFLFVSFNVYLYNRDRVIDSAETPNKE